MPSRTQDDTRRFRRQGLRILVDYSCEGGLHCDYATSISAGGLFGETLWWHVHSRASIEFNPVPLTPPNELGQCATFKLGNQIQNGDLDRVIRLGDFRRILETKCSPVGGISPDQKWCDGFVYVPCRGFVSGARSKPL